MQPNSRTEWRQTPECGGVDYCMEGNYKHRVVDALLERLTRKPKDGYNACYMSC